MAGSYGQARWQHARKLALERAGHRCERDGERTGLHVHHLDEQGMNGPRATDLDNLVVLCAKCHRREHGVLPQRD